MFVCQWHLDIPFGKPSEALRIMTAWGKEKLAVAIVPGSQRWVAYRVLA